MPWVDGDNLTPTNLNNTVPDWYDSTFPDWLKGPGSSSSTVVQYVGKHGDNSNDGLTWETAVASVASAVSNLPQRSVSGISYSFGHVFIGPGTFSEPGDLDCSSHIKYEGLGGQSTQFGTEPTRSVVKLADSANTWLFQPRAGWANNTHNVWFENLSIDGNDDNQTHPADVSGVNITFVDGDPAEIGRASGDFTTDWQAGDFVEVQDSDSNDGVYEIGSVSATTLFLTQASGNKRRHQVIDEGPTAGITLQGARFGLVRLFNGGFGCRFDHVYFRDSRIAFMQESSYANVTMRQVMFSTHKVRALFLRTYGGGLFLVDGGQGDTCGKFFAEFHRNGTGAGSMLIFRNFKTEGGTGALPDHKYFLEIRPLENGGGNLQTVMLDGVRAIGPTGGTITNSAMVHERAGDGVSLQVIMINPEATRYDALYRSDKNDIVFRHELTTDYHSIPYGIFGGSSAPTSFPAVVASPVATSFLPSAGTDQNGKIYLENDASNGQNIIFYSGDSRWRVSGTTF